MRVSRPASVATARLTGYCEAALPEIILTANAERSVVAVDAQLQDLSATRFRRLRNASGSAIAGATLPGRNVNVEAV